MLGTGAAAPTFTLSQLGGGEVSDPWRDGPLVLAFFKTSCPVCRMSAPMMQAMAESGARVVAIGEDPPAELEEFAGEEGLAVPILTEPVPYPVSDAYDLDTVPSLFLVDRDGTVLDTTVSWDRVGWNRLSTAAGGAEVSHDGDGRPPQRPG
ncbi:MAG: redoxin domain-containing protein [Acidimicrobiia bacterium]